jgi:hypothetical protein
MAGPGRSPFRSEGGILSAVERAAPGSERELAEFIEWIRSLGHDELLELSNAEFDFERSELIARLHALEGDWVVAALGRFAIAENDPLLKAILVEGLVGGGMSFERMDDEGILPILDSLLLQMSMQVDDPYRVASGLATAAFGACLRNGEDYVQWMAAHLASSDNRSLLTHGYLFMGRFPGSEETLRNALLSHADDAGRFGAIEGLRQAATDGRIPPEEITALGLQALAGETHPRNRLLTMEMIVSTGGEAGLGAAEEIARNGTLAEMGSAVELLALKGDPARSLALIEELMTTRELDAEAEKSLYTALGVLPDGEGRELLLGIVRDEERDAASRLAGLEGLWNQEVDDELAGELETLFHDASDPAMRTEALRMLASGEREMDLDLRAIASVDPDPGVRAEAVMLAAMSSGADARTWLEERLHQDDSYDVKAAALGGLVLHAHYTGDGEPVVAYLERARKLTRDESTLAMIAEGERMVRDHDPRRLELELAEELDFLETIAQYTEGPARRAFQRESRMTRRLVETLRSAKR